MLHLDRTRLYLPVDCQLSCDSMLMTDFVFPYGRSMLRGLTVSTDADDR